MSGLKSDELGFLIGKPINLTDLHDELSDIHGELSEIKQLLKKDAVVDISPDSLDQLTSAFSTNLAAENEKNADKAPDKISVPGAREIKKEGSPFANLDRLIASQLDNHAVNQNGQNEAAKFQPRDAHGRFTSPVNPGEAVKVPQVRNVANSLSIQNARTDGPGVENHNQDITQNTLNNTVYKRSSQAENIASPSTQTTVNNSSKTAAKRDEKGRFIASPSAKEAISTPKNRGANGQFLPKGTNSESNTPDKVGAEKDSIGTKIKNVGSKISDAIGGLAQDNEQADPSVQAMGEIKGVLSPVGRGLGKLFTGGNGGVSRGQDRWYRRFFKQNTEKARADELANKREQRLLSNIEKKEGPEVASNHGLMATLFLAFMGALAGLLIKGFQALATPLRFLGSFFGPLLKALQALARAIGLKKLADRIGSPGTKNPGNKSGGPAGTVKDSSTKGGAGKAILKKLPIVGALMSAGFLGKELYDISENDEAKEIKTKQVGSAVGSTVGGVGGALGGAAAGAAVGSMVPLVGTLVGGIVGAVLGGIGGDKLGGILGDKFGAWVNDLRSSGFIDRMSYRWDVGVNAMSIMWRDFTSLASSVWSGMVAGLQGGWNAVVNTTQLMWQNVSSAFTSATDFIKSTWATTAAVVGGALDTVWTSLGELASQLNEAIKAKTGVDIAQNVDDMKKTVAGWADGLKAAVNDVSNSFKEKLGGMFEGSYLGGVFSQAQNMADTNNEPLSTSKEQDANQTGVLNAFLKAGFTKNQAIALTAEVGRENDYNSKNLYGYHKDAANGAVNMGMISWQGDRAKRLEEHMQSKGLIKDGKMVRSQAALDAQAEFVKKEIDGGQYKATKKLFSESPNLDPEAYAKTLGKDYIKWAYGQNVLSNGNSFDWKKHDAKRRGYKVKAAAKTSTAIPFRPGYNAQTAQAAIAEKGKGQATSTAAPKADQNTANAPQTETVTASMDATQAEEKAAPNSIESLMQTVNNFDGMSNIKHAVVTMLKSSAEGPGVAQYAPRKTPVVPAVNVSAAPPIAEAPKVSTPIASTQTAQDSNKAIDDVSRDLSDRRIAHIVTGAYSSPT